MSKCIIMCAGSFTPMDLEREAGDFVIAADNGLSYLDAIGVAPDFCIGDYDSLEEKEKNSLSDLEKKAPEKVKTLPVEKDDTDSMAAVRVGFSKGFRQFVLYGALGGSRLDHTIANLQTLNFIKTHGGEGYIVDEKCILFIIKDEGRSFPPGFSGGFSLFAIDPEIQGVTIRGMKYNVEDVTISNAFPIGVSNHISADQAASVYVQKGAALVYLSWNDEESRRKLFSGYFSSPVL